MGGGRAVLGCAQGWPHLPTPTTPFAARAVGWSEPPIRGRHPTTASTEVLVQISITRGRHLLADRYPRVNGEGFPPARRAALAMLPGPPSWALCKSVPTRMYCPRGSSTELFLEHCQVGCV